MATLVDLYAEVDGHADTVKRLPSDNVSESSESVTIYYKTGAITATSIRKWVFVKDRGLPTEKAYWDGGKPAYLTAADAFPDDLAAYIVTYQAAHPEFEKYEVVNTFNTAKYAVVKGYVFESGAGTSSEKQYIFWKQGATWYVREIV